jgi:hypothetical protein
MHQSPSHQCRFWGSALLALLLGVPQALVAAQHRRNREGTLVKLQSFHLGGYAYHISFLLTPTESLVRTGDFIVTVGGTSGSMTWDVYDKARSYRIKADGRLAFVRELPVRARTLALLGDTVYAIAFDRDKNEPRDDSGNPVFSTFTHIEAFQLDKEKSQAKVVLRGKPPLRYTTFMKCLIPRDDGIIVAESPRPQHSSTDRISILSGDLKNVMATHFVKKRKDQGSIATEPGLPYWDDLNKTILSLTANENILAARLAGDRIRLLDIQDSLKARHEMKLKGLRAIALSNDTLYAYTGDGILRAFDVSSPETSTQLWARRIPTVPNARGMVIDGDRILVHGIGLTVTWINDAHPARYYRVGYRWKSLECVIPNGDLIYAFNGAASVSKLMVFRLEGPR